MFASFRNNYLIFFFKGGPLKRVCQMTGIKFDGRLYDMALFISSLRRIDVLFYFSERSRQWKHPLRPCMLRIDPMH